jgi:hypothetical protein
VEPRRLPNAGHQHLLREIERCLGKELEDAVESPNEPEQLTDGQTKQSQLSEGPV